MTDQNGKQASAPDSGQYKENSLSLVGAVSMRTGVMIGAGILALTGQVAEQAGGLFPLAFLAGALVSAFSAYSYVKVSNAYPSAGGIAMSLKKAYCKGTMTADCSLLMYFSMVINESLVARTFGTYPLQLFDVDKNSWLVPALGVGLLAFAFGVNIAGNRFIGAFSMVTALIKVGGIALFEIVGLWLSGFSFESVAADHQTLAGGLLAAVTIWIFFSCTFVHAGASLTSFGAEKRLFLRDSMVAIGDCLPNGKKQDLSSLT